MFISRKKYAELLEQVKTLEKRVRELEYKITTNSFDFGTNTDLKKLCRELPKFVDKRAAAVLDNRLKKLSS